MTVAELVAILNTYPADLPVMFEWDGGWTSPWQIRVEVDPRFPETLVIDVSDYHHGGNPTEVIPRP